MVIIITARITTILEGCDTRRWLGLPLAQPSRLRLPSAAGSDMLAPDTMSCLQ